ncbi:hypothetical protein I0Q91_04610 [Halanaerobiaceae bacterium Z-7014]|uniref:Uncharacterized protein n=1 Tax=Halonatronomonas betaini TaxID=2778430 RepID=A0A931AP24_9FIRM|nr:hypothetical protein [Halonatronomonas betaini]MBF8436353.1 hypothetical protein [Halonatronomonas betaini]
MERRSEEFKDFLNYYVDEVIRRKIKKEDEELESVDENVLAEELKLNIEEDIKNYFNNRFDTVILKELKQETVRFLDKNLEDYDIIAREDEFGLEMEYYIK